MDNPLALFIGIIVIVAVGIAAYYLYHLMQKTVTRQAKLVAKRTLRIPAAAGNPPQMSYYCTFEFDDGQRAEYYVGAHQYGLIAEGARGELDTKGALFWGFRRAS